MTIFLSNSHINIFYLLSQFSSEHIFLNFLCSKLIPVFLYACASIDILQKKVLELEIITEAIPTAFLCLKWTEYYTTINILQNTQTQKFIWNYLHLKYLWAISIWSKVYLLLESTLFSIFAWRSEIYFQGITHELHVRLSKFIFRYFSSKFCLEPWLL